MVTVFGVWLLWLLFDCTAVIGCLWYTDYVIVLFV